jgi:hypothetical protein
MKYAICTAAALAVAGPACAQPFAIKPVVDTRLRYEHVDQEGLADETSEALTFRLRAGLEAKSGPWSALVEGQATMGLVNDYYDGLHGLPVRPLIADPENVSLYRAQVQYKSKAVAVTGGRQRIALDDERFVGAVGWRQNGQTFDAVRAEFTEIPKLRIDLTYAWQVNTIWGVDGSEGIANPDPAERARQRRVDGDNVFANVGYATPIGTLTGFGYWIDQDELAVQGFRLASKTFGARLAGARPIGKAKITYQLSYARQADFHRNPNDYAADYYLADAAVELGRFKLGAGYEVLGADEGAALTSFQTPLATLFKFQGWADKFLVTPPNGVRDLYASATATLPKLAGTDAVTLQAVGHRFRSDRLGQHYGTEIDLLASAKVKRATVSLRFARYDADEFATDTRKLWLQLEWAY